MKASKKRHSGKLISFFTIVTVLGCIVFAVLMLTMHMIPNLSQLSARAASTTYVTRSGSNLYLNGQPFRFSGANIYWLGLDENVNGVNYPTKFRTDDALATAKEMGATVVRSHTLGISVGCEKCLKPTLNTTNDAAFDSIDYAIASAKNKDLRLIIPLTDNWNYFHGGKKTFTDWRGLTNEEEFYTNAQVIEDYKAYITYVLNHVNTYTGVALKDEPAIMAWETGNEMDSASVIWTTAIADHIKSIDSKHLIADGRNVRSNFQNVDIAKVDMYTDHFYPLNAAQMKSDAAGVVAKKKVFYVGEFDWTDRSAKKPEASLTSDTSNKTSGSRAAKVTVTQPGRDWDVQLMQGNRTITGGKTNTLEFWAKASAPRNVRVVLQKNYSPWSTYTEQTFALTTAWTKYTMTVNPTATDTNTLLAINVAETGGTLWLDNISLSNGSTNTIQNGSFETTSGSGFASWSFVHNATNVDPLSTFLPVVENGINGVSGSLYWSLFGHNDTYGYVQHNDSYTMHFPGDTADMTTKADQLRNHAYKMRNQSVPSPRCPNAPVMQPLGGKDYAVAVSWRGSVAAKTYNIQRSTSNSLSWQTVKTGLTDNNTPWIDTAGRMTYKYRVQAVNAYNVSGPFSDGTASSNCKVTSATP